RAQAILQQLDARQCNVEARAAALGPGTEPAFALLRDEIGFDSYSGVLRGAQGTYAQRAGNALDRALLLAELLRHKGLVVRFARGRLPAERSEQLVQRLFALPAPVDPALLTASAGLRTRLERLRARAERDYTALKSAIGARAPAATSSHDELLAEVQDHFWVQVRQGEQWLDLDPTFADSEPGQCAVTAEQTYEQIPLELHQTVTVRVLAEHLAAGALVSRTLLTASRPAVQWIEQQVFVLHAPQDNLGSAVADALSGADSRPWRPVLFCNGDIESGATVTFGRQAHGGVADALGAAPPEATDPQAAPAAGGIFVAEWLELELHFPDGRSELYRRALVDRAGPAMRTAGLFAADKLAPLADDARGPLFCQDVHQLVFSSSRHDLHDYAEALVALSAGLAAPPAAEPAAEPAAGDGKVAPPAAGLEALWPFALQSFGWMFVADERLIPALNDLAGVRLYADAPRIWIASLTHGRRGGGNEFVVDLRRDKLRGLCDVPARSGELAARKLWYAALTGGLEHEVLAEMAVNVAIDPRTVATTSASVDGKAMIVLAAADADKVTTVTPAAVPAAQVAAALQRGSLVVVSQSAAAGADTAFWEIDGNGDTRAVYGLDWNGALLPTVTTASRAGGVGLPNPSYTSRSMRGPMGSAPKGNFRYVPARGGGSEYTALLVAVLAVGIEFFIIGVAVAAVAGWI
ncbi:MAG TPA: hypothetical protein VK348_11845, partial [Planctomycetota bacterium]|nr:hypothetical protein [Planctomycetota bacterium]